MNVVVLAGGQGTRLAEETEIRPKPLVEIGERPILWHILKHYRHHGFRQFCIALGYKGDQIKRYFIDYCDLHGSMSVDLTRGVTDRRDSPREDWLLHLIETGRESLTGERVKRMRFLLNRRFMLTYGDAVADVDLTALLEFHRSHGRIATITAVRPPARFGGLVLDGDAVTVFAEKPQIGEGWINGGYAVFEPQIFDYLQRDNCSLEVHALTRLAVDGQLAAYRHEGFWQCMDTLRDKHQLQAHWVGGDAPWKVWR